MSDWKVAKVKTGLGKEGRTVLFFIFMICEIDHE